MKKTIAVLTAAVMTLSLAGCSSEQKTVVSYSEENYVKTVKEYDENGRLLTETMYSKGMTAWNFGGLVVYMYDDSGVLTASETYATDAVIEKTSITDFFLIKQAQYRADGTISKEIYYNNDGEASYVGSVYEYDENGEIISEIVYDEEGNVIQ